MDIREPMFTLFPYTTLFRSHERGALLTGGIGLKRRVFILCVAPIQKLFSRPCSPFISLLYTLLDRKSTRLNSSHVAISYAVFCLKKKTDIEIKVDPPELTIK